jgi:pimeloyl-ACP methyl ester carboxylesterase
MAAQGLHVEIRGSGPGLALAHGFGGSARNWRPQVRALAGRFRIATYDARGHARSATLAGAGEARIEAAVEDLASVAADVGPAPVVGGLSMGAAVALALALRAPLALAGLVLAAPPAGPASGRGISARARAFADAIERDGLEGAGARYAWGPESGLDANGAALVRAGFLEHDARSLALLLRELLAALPAPEQRAPELGALALPTLVVVGALDSASRASAETLAAAIPGARLCVIPDAGHVVNLAQPARFNAVLGAFLDGLPACRSSR